MTYNGYANWDTWNVSLWVDNEHPLYLKKIRLFDRTQEPIKAGQVKEFVAGYMAGTTPDEPDMGKVDWTELAEMWETGRQEHWLYKFDAQGKYDTFDEYLLDKKEEIQAALAPYDLGIRDEEIMELLVSEEGDVEGIIQGYTEGEPEPKQDRPDNMSYAPKSAEAAMMLHVDELCAGCKYMVALSVPNSEYKFSAQCRLGWPGVFSEETVTCERYHKVQA